MCVIQSFAYSTTTDGVQMSSLDFSDEIDAIRALNDCETAAVLYSDFPLQQKYSGASFTKNCLKITTDSITSTDPNMQNIQFHVQIPNAATIGASSRIILCMDLAGGIDDCYVSTFQHDNNAGQWISMEVTDILPFTFTDESFVIIIDGISMYPHDFNAFINFKVIEKDTNITNMMFNNNSSSTWTTTQTVTAGSITTPTNEFVMRRDYGSGKVYVPRENTMGIAVMQPNTVQDVPSSSGTTMDIAHVCAGNHQVVFGSIQNNMKESHDGTFRFNPCTLSFLGFNNTFGFISDASIAPKTFVMALSTNAFFINRFSKFPSANRSFVPNRALSMTYENMESKRPVTIRAWTEYEHVDEQGEPRSLTFFTMFLHSADGGQNDEVIRTSLPNATIHALLRPVFRPDPDHTTIYDSLFIYSDDVWRSDYVEAIIETNEGTFLAMVNPRYPELSLQPLFTISTIDTSASVFQNNTQLMQYARPNIASVVPLKYNLTRDDKSVGIFAVSSKLFAGINVWTMDISDTVNNTDTINISTSNNKPSGVDFGIYPQEAVFLSHPTSSDPAYQHDMTMVSYHHYTTNYPWTVFSLESEDHSILRLYSWSPLDTATTHLVPTERKVFVFANPIKTPLQLQSDYLTVGELKLILSTTGMTFDHMMDNNPIYSTFSNVDDQDDLDTIRELLDSKDNSTILGHLHLIYSAYEISLVFFPLDSYSTALPKQFPIAHITPGSLLDIVDLIEEGDIESSNIEPFRTVQLNRSDVDIFVRNHSIDFSLNGKSYSIPLNSFRKHFAVLVDYAFGSENYDFSSFRASWNESLQGLTNPSLLTLLIDSTYLSETLSVPFLINVLPSQEFGYMSSNNLSNMLFLSYGNNNSTINVDSGHASSAFSTDFSFKQNSIQSSKPSLLGSSDRASPLNPLDNFTFSTTVFWPSDTANPSTGSGKLYHIIEDSDFIAIHREDASGVVISSADNEDVFVQASNERVLCANGYYRLGSVCEIVPYGFYSADGISLNGCTNLNELCPIGSITPLDSVVYSASTTGVSLSVPLNSNSAENAQDDSIFIEYVMESFSSIMVVVFVATIAFAVCGLQIGIFRDALKKVDFITAGDQYIDNNPGEDAKFDDMDPKMANRQSVLVLRSPITGIVSIMVVFACLYIIFQSWQFILEYEEAEAGVSLPLPSYIGIDGHEVPEGFSEEGDYKFKSNTKHDCMFKNKNLLDAFETKRINSTGVLVLRIIYNKGSSMSCTALGTNIVASGGLKADGCDIAGASCQDALDNAFRSTLGTTSVRVAVFGEISPNTCVIDVGEMFQNHYGLTEHVTIHEHFSFDLQIRDVFVPTVAIDFGFEDYRHATSNVNESLVRLTTPIDSSEFLMQSNIVFEVSMMKSITFEYSSSPTVSYVSPIMTVSPNVDVHPTTSATDMVNIHVDVNTTDQCIVCKHSPNLTLATMFAILFVVVISVYELGCLVGKFALVIRDFTEPIWAALKREKPVPMMMGEMGMDPTLMSPMYETEMMADPQLQGTVMMAAGPGAMMGGNMPPPQQPPMSMGRNISMRGGPPPPPGGPPPVSLRGGNRPPFDGPPPM